MGVCLTQNALAESVSNFLRINPKLINRTVISAPVAIMRRILDGQRLVIRGDNKYQYF